MGIMISFIITQPQQALSFCVLYIHQCFVSHGIVFLKYTISSKMTNRSNWGHSSHVFTLAHMCMMKEHGGSGGIITSCILNLGWRGVMSIIPQSLYYWIGGCVDTRTCLDVWRNEKFLTFTGIWSVMCFFNVVKLDRMPNIKLGIWTVIPLAHAIAWTLYWPQFHI